MVRSAAARIAASSMPALRIFKFGILFFFYRCDCLAVQQWGRKIPQDEHGFLSTLRLITGRTDQS
jgi:hypothetical protein